MHQNWAVTTHPKDWM